MEGPIFYLLHRPTISSDFGYLVHFGEVNVRQQRAYVSADEVTDMLKM